MSWSCAWVDLQDLGVLFGEKEKKERKKMGKGLRGGWGREGGLTDWIDGAPSKERTNKELNVEPMFRKKKKEKVKK